ncbi:hypothetical protein AN218_14535 [Streptomyces nanshensis]|uniref:Uncharacterized protein n=1 Tax=Streptomyces nanshensis TaxID=518642 RepID=A0A1E7L4H4_9ACTN|nr:hypothetical protein AN218_14535 [Streptomyces nanshensis]
MQATVDGCATQCECSIDSASVEFDCASDLGVEELNFPRDMRVRETEPLSDVHGYAPQAGQLTRLHMHIDEAGAIQDDLFLEGTVMEPDRDLDESSREVQRASDIGPVQA